MKKKRNTLSKLDRILEMPQEVYSDIPKITITGFNEIIIENFKGILEYEDYYMLFADMEDNIKMYVKLIKKQEKRYDSIKDKFQDETLKEEDKVILTYFEIMEIFD